MTQPAEDRPRDWIEALARLRDARTPCALVVVTRLVGSGPREPGARMVVAEGRPVHGTIGEECVTSSGWFQGCDGRRKEVHAAAKGRY